MPQMGVSVAEGTVVAWRVGVGDADRGRADDLRDLHRQDRHRGAVAGERRGGRDPGRASTRRSRSGRCWRGSPWRAAPSPGARAGAAGDGGAAAAASAPASTPAPRRPARPRARGGRYSPVVQRIAAEHDIDLSTVEGTGRGGRVRKQDVLALVNGNGHAGGACRTRRCTSRARTGPTRRRPPRPADAVVTGRAAACRGCAADRRAHEAVAGHRGDVHDLDRGRHEPRRGRARQAGRHRAGLRRAGDGRRAARAPGAERLAQRRGLRARRRTSTSGSRCRWARTG